jgi:hypothetical protein
MHCGDDEEMGKGDWWLVVAFLIFLLACLAGAYESIQKMEHKGRWQHDTKSSEYRKKYGLTLTILLLSQKFKTSLKYLIVL